MNPLKELADDGQSVWLDYLSRHFVESGGLARLVGADGLAGVTSNPAIFEKAIAGSDEYADAIRALAKQKDLDDIAIYESLVVQDIRHAADALAPVFARTKGADGFVSLECSPYLANETPQTVAEAEKLWSKVDHPNLMVKVPGTKAGVPAIETLIGRGLNINVTLLFSVTMYERVAEAYIAGLETLERNGGDVSKVASVASFFISRIDTAVDAALDKLGEKGAHLKGKTAIANAKIAYERYEDIYSSARWRALEAKGAKPQRLLWASTSTKNPAYRDTIYIEELIGRNTVNTMPPATLDAFRDHGVVKPDAILQDRAGAHATMRELAQLGVSIDAVTDALTVDGVRLFSEAFDKLLASVAERRRAFATEGA